MYLLTLTEQFGGKVMEMKLHRLGDASSTNSITRAAGTINCRF